MTLTNEPGSLGSLTTIIGLPLLEVIGALQELGWKMPIRSEQGSRG